MHGSSRKGRAVGSSAACGMRFRLRSRTVVPRRVFFLSHKPPLLSPKPPKIPTQKQHAAPRARAQSKATLQQQLQQLARQAQTLILWLDCDREGENIGFEVMRVCQTANARLAVRRARFSALIPRELHSALANLVAPNERDADAVDARQEIDLRVGASFTRFQTMLLRDKFDWRAGGGAGGGAGDGGLDDGGRPKVISYGPCQFPTLGLIVQRAWEIQSHASEPYWQIQASLRTGPPPGGASCDFAWARGRLFDRDAAAAIYEACREAPEATVVDVRGARRLKHAPSPLTTLEMQKRGTQFLRLPGEREPRGVWGWGLVERGGGRAGVRLGQREERGTNKTGHPTLHKPKPTTQPPS